MRTDDQILEEFNRLEDVAYRTQVISNFSRVTPAPGKLRIVIVCFPFYSYAGDVVGNIFPDGKAAAFTNPRSPESRLVSSALVKAWMERFAEHIRSGNGM